MSRKLLQGPTYKRSLELVQGTAFKMSRKLLQGPTYKRSLELVQ